MEVNNYLLSLKFINFKIYLDFCENSKLIDLINM